MKPPIIYYGAKVNVAEQIAALLPEHTHYVEPFAGSLAVLLAKKPSRMETVNDLDRDLMLFWKVLRERGHDLERVAALTPHSRAEYEAACGPLDGLDDLEHARRIWVRLTQGRSGTLRTKTGWRFDAADTAHSSMPRRLAGYRERLAEASARLSSVSLECRPALDVIAAYGHRRNTLLYVDPPYLGTTRERNYRHEMTGEASHRELAAALHACRATVVLSGYASDLYDADLYRGWHRHTLQAATSQGGQWAERTEVLWSNRPLRVADSTLPLFGNETPDEDAPGGQPCNETPCEAPGCELPVAQPKTGRPRRFCSPACRVSAHRSGKVA